MTTVVLEGLDEALLDVVRDVLKEVLGERPREASPWMTAAEAADYLRTSEAAVRAARKRRRIPFTKNPLGNVRFHRDDLDAWMRNGGVL